MSLLLATKIAAQILLPPGILAWLGLLSVRYWKRWGRWLALALFAILYLLATEPVKDALLAPLENAYPPLAAGEVPPDAVIVLLGGGLRENAPEYGGEDRLSGESLLRTVYAAELARRTGRLLIATGGAPLSEESLPEAEIMRNVLLELGVDGGRILVETQANTTWENARNVASMLLPLGKRKVILVTSAWHMPRAMFAFEQFGFVPMAAPCAFRTTFRPYDARSVLPHWESFYDSCHALHEFLGLFWYRIRPW